jgi:diguanylate cyclase (GGDEF)-like protein
MSEVSQHSQPDWDPGVGMPKSRPKLTLVTVGSDSVTPDRTLRESPLGAERRDGTLSHSGAESLGASETPTCEVSGALMAERPRIAGVSHSGAEKPENQPSDEINEPASVRAGRDNCAQKKASRRGDDLFKQLSDEKMGLELASAQLAQWAQSLEERVADRTQEIARRNSQLTMLNTLAKAINQSLDPVEMSQSVLQLVCDLFGAEKGALWICPKGTTMTVRVNHGLSNVWQRRLRRGWPTNDLLAVHMQSRFSAIVVDTSRDTSPEARMGRHIGMGSAAIVPIKSRTDVIGLMVVGSEDKDVFDVDDATVFDVFSDQFGVGITNAFLYEEARRRAERDPVTGLFNHRTLQQKLVAGMETADAEHENLAVVLMDIDNFKFFNDTYGHLCGDDVLRTVGMAIEQSCADEDTSGRYGGDEFMVVLPGADHDAAAKIAQSIRKTLSDAGYSPTDSANRVPLTISFGVAVYPSDGVSRHDMIAQADANLYRNKFGGDVTSNPSPYVGRARSIPGYEMLDALVTTVDNKDRYTRRHSEDVADYAYKLGEVMGLEQETLDTLAVAGLLHDVGKIAVPDSILRKPGKLTANELIAIQCHPAFGALIVGAIPSLQYILPAVRHHHERWDGRGYPDGLAGTDIPLIARIMAVADAVSAMTTDRPYRSSMTWDAVVDALEKGLGTQFDPEIGRIHADYLRKTRLSYMAPTPGLRLAA